MSKSQSSYPAPRFANVSCSQCGREFGPGNAGFSHCQDHEATRLPEFNSNPFAWARWSTVGLGPDIMIGSIRPDGEGWFSVHARFDDMPEIPAPEGGLREAAQKALEVLEELQGGCTDSADGTVEAITVWCPEVIDALRAALAAQPKTASAEDWVRAIAPLMPADFKDWHDNNPCEWPDVTAAVIKALREDREHGWEMAALAAQAATVNPDVTVAAPAEGDEVAALALLRAAFEEGFSSRETYNDVTTNTVEDAWASANKDDWYGKKLRALPSKVQPKGTAQQLAELMRGLEIGVEFLQCTPAAFYELGRRIADQAKESPAASPSPAPAPEGYKLAPTDATAEMAYLGKPVETGPEKALADVAAGYRREMWAAMMALAPTVQAPAVAPAEPDMRAVCAALGFDPTNHHNAAKCPYCRPVQQEQPLNIRCAACDKPATTVGGVFPSCSCGGKTFNGTIFSQPPVQAHGRRVMEPRPIMQRCTFCGQDWWDSHVCTPPKDMLAKLTKMLPPAPPEPLPQGLRVSANLTEADVRRIVREELARDMEERRAKLRAFVAEVHGAGDPAGDPIMDSRCEYLYPPSGRCDKCGNVHDGKPPVVNFPSTSQEVQP